jgi:prohibitin 1
MSPIKSVIAGVIAVFVLIMVLGSFTVIGTGTRGIVTTFGKVHEGILDEGIHFVRPFIDSVTKMSVRYNTNDVRSEAASKDMQSVHFVVAVTWKLNSASVNTVYQTIGDEDAVLGNILAPAVFETVKASTAKMTAEEILTKRASLKENIDSVLKARANQYGILLDQVSIKDIKFGDDYTKAIEEKQIAEQNAKKASYDADRAREEAKAEVNRAEGKAKAQKLLRDTVSPKLLSQQAIEKWDGHFPSTLVMGKNDGNMLFSIPVNPKQDTSKEE